MSETKVKPKLLFVETDPKVLSALLPRLEQVGFHVVMVPDFDQAVNRFKLHDFHLVIANLDLPGRGGLQLMNEVNPTGARDLSFIFLSGNADAPLEDFLTESASIVFTEPFDFDKIIDRVQTESIEKLDHWHQKPKRVEVDFKVDVQLEGLGDISDGSVVNIGRGGMFLAIRYPLPPVGKTIRFKIRWSYEKPDELIEGEGIVRWIRLEPKDSFPTGCGVEFTYLTDTSIDHLSQFLNETKTRRFIPKR